MMNLFEEYEQRIQVYQDEINKLATENEQVKESNQRLMDELTKLRKEKPKSE